MAFIPTDQKPKPTMPISKEGGLHSEITIYHPTGEERPEVDQAKSSVPGAKKYLLWFLVALIVFAAVLVFILK